LRSGFTVLGQQVEGSARRWATLTVTLIAGLASTVFVLLITALLGHGGLHMALAGMLLLVGLPVWWVVPDRGAARVTPIYVAFSPDQPSPGWSGRLPCRRS
ncbi:MAG: putative major facilitator superfamily, partial [Deinococcus sp.]|nr:putative major facilitator superfamily [Deinococcus sp.]